MLLHAACKQAGVEPVFIEYEGNDPVSYVVPLNLHSRHLDESQRAMVASKISTLGKGQRADRVDGSIDLSTAARSFNVSEPSVKCANKVNREGSAELVEAVEQGRISVSAAADVSELPQEEQREVVAVKMVNPGVGQPEKNPANLHNTSRAEAAEQISVAARSNKSSKIL